jgi:hypothetical protein
MNIRTNRTVEKAAQFTLEKDLFGSEPLSTCRKNRTISVGKNDSKIDTVRKDLLKKKT